MSASDGLRFGVIGLVHHFVLAEKMQHLLEEATTIQINEEELLQNTVGQLKSVKLEMTTGFIGRERGGGARARLVHPNGRECYIRTLRVINEARHVHQGAVDAQNSGHDHHVLVLEQVVYVEHHGFFDVLWSLKLGICQVRKFFFFLLILLNPQGLPLRFNAQNFRPSNRRGIS